MWKIGDRAIILKSVTGKQVGKVTTVLSDLYPVGNDTEMYFKGDMVHEIDAKPYNSRLKICVIKPEHLGPIPDANEKTTWDECVFKPKVFLDA